jgi:hypothetical protein
LDAAADFPIAIEFSPEAFERSPIAIAYALVVVDVNPIETVFC